jgi:hemerythrin superfamily protein
MTMPMPMNPMGPMDPAGFADSLQPLDARDMEPETGADRDHDNRDLIDILLEDHREVEQLFAELESGQGTPERRRDVADAVIAELVRHSVAEEEYLYPTARRILSDGDQIADDELREHAEAERTMKVLEPLDATDPDFDETAATLMREIRHHILEEERDLFPRLLEACSADELRQLGRKAQLAKKISPTRPHPSAPDTPPWNKVLGPGVGLIDRVRDALTNRKTSPHDVKPDIQ